jgi:hypothetical protein
MASSNPVTILSSQGYRVITNINNGVETPTYSVYRLYDQVSVNLRPECHNSSDYLEYQAWLSQGNEPSLPPES